MFKKPQIDDDYLFDDFVCNDLFVAEKFLAKVTIHESDRLRVTQHLLPNYIFKEIATGKEFYVQTISFIPSSKQSEIIWCDEKQLPAFKSLSLPLYVIIGQGNDPYNPTKLFCVPLKALNTNSLNINDVLHYRVADKTDINKWL